MGLYGHETGAEYALAVADGIVRGHHGVHLALGIPGEKGHRHGLAELLEDLGVGEACLPAEAPAVAPAAGLVHHAVYGLLVHVVGERLVLLPLEFAVEILLEPAAEVGADGLHGILLHLVVDGGVDAQAVLVEVVARSVRLLVLVEPAVDRVVAPADGIGGVVLRAFIVGAARALGGEVAADHVAEVRREAGVVVLHLELVGGDGYLLDGIAGRLVQESRLGHLAEHEVAALERIIIM